MPSTKLSWHLNDQLFLAVHHRVQRMRRRRLRLALVDMAMLFLLIPLIVCFAPIYWAAWLMHVLRVPLTILSAAVAYDLSVHWDSLFEVAERVLHGPALFAVKHGGPMMIGGVVAYATYEWAKDVTTKR